MRMTVFAVYGLQSVATRTASRPRIVASPGTALPSGNPGVIGGMTPTA